MQRNKISFKGQKIFIGIDVHKKNWDVAIAPEIGIVKRHPQKASAKELFDFLKKHYPDGDYLAVYESGFSGFSTYYALRDVGINSIVIHAADVPTTQYEEVMKTDKIDSIKLARSLKAGLLKGIYVREKENIDDRSVVRIRKTILKDLTSYKSRVKHMLHSNGVLLPERFEKPGSHWSKAFIKWLKEDVTLLSSSRNSLDLLIRQVETIRKTLLDATRMIRDLSQAERYRHNYDLLMTIPGIGVVVSMCILTELYDVKRFHNEKEFAAYYRLCCTCRTDYDIRSILDGSTGKDRLEEHKTQLQKVSFEERYLISSMILGILCREMEAYQQKADLYERLLDFSGSFTDTGASDLFRSRILEEEVRMKKRKAAGLLPPQ